MHAAPDVRCTVLYGMLSAKSTWLPHGQLSVHVLMQMLSILLTLVEGDKHPPEVAQQALTSSWKMQLTMIVALADCCQGVQDAVPGFYWCASSSWGRRRAMEARWRAAGKCCWSLCMTASYCGYQRLRTAVCHKVPTANLECHEVGR